MRENDCSPSYLFIVKNFLNYKQVNKRVAILPRDCFERRQNMTKRQSVASLHRQKMNMFKRQKEKLITEKESYQKKVMKLDKNIKEINTTIEALEKKYNKVLQLEAEIAKVQDSYYDFADSISNNNARKGNEIPSNQEGGNAATLQENTSNEDSVDMFSDDAF